MATFKKAFIVALATFLLCSCSGGESTTDSDTTESPSSSTSEPTPKGKPHFLSESYTYDKVAGGNLEMPIALDGAEFFYLQINDETINPKLVHFDDKSSCIVIDEDYVLSLKISDYSARALTTGDEEPAECQIRIVNSIKTSFDEEKTKYFNFGKQKYVSYSIDLNGTQIKRLKMGETIVDPSFYDVVGNEFRLYDTWVGLTNGSADYTLVLSNNDSYNFTVKNNVIFYTDYDVSTIHNSLISTTGQNPLYQYSTEESINIVDHPVGSMGKCLRYKPNYNDVALDCHGIMTLRATSTPYTWYNAGFETDSNYAISFDYYTTDTTIGNFAFKTATDSFREELLLGEENDEIVHHYSCILSGEQIGLGIMIWAFFKNGSGYVYLDNYRVTQIDEIPSLSTIPDYSNQGDYEFSFDSKGLIFDIAIDGEKVNYNYTENKVTIAENDVKNLKSGIHQLEIITPVNTFVKTFKVVEIATIEFVNTTAQVDVLQNENAVFYGNFSDNLSIVSVKQKAKSDNGGFDGWSFCQTNETKDYKNFLTFEKGTSGSLTISKDIVSKTYKSTQFDVEFNNGSIKTLTVNNNIEMFTDYDNTSINGYFKGSLVPWSPLHSGLNGSSVSGVEEREPGNNAFFVRSTSGAEAPNIFTIKYHSHVWDWYTVKGQSGRLYQTSFTYQIYGLNQNSVYFFLMTPDKTEEEVKSHFFGDYDSLEWVAGDNYYKVKFNLIADGNVHTFNSGFYTFDSVLRMSKIMLPSFKKTSGCYVMVDDFCITSKAA